MHCGQLYYQTRQQSEASVSIMDSLGGYESQAQILKDSTILYLHCVDTQYQMQLRIAGLPLMGIQSYFCHFSFTNSLSNRRICILPNSDFLLKKLEGVNLPCVISVTASTVFKVSFLLFTAIFILNIYVLAFCNIQ